jgi:hypothetical protein
MNTERIILRFSDSQRKNGGLLWHVRTSDEDFERHNVV